RRAACLAAVGAAACRDGVGACRSIDPGGSLAIWRSPARQIRGARAGSGDKPGARTVSAQNDEKDLEEGRMPLIEHLIELRSRLVRCAIWVGVAFLVCYYFKEQIYAFLSHPLAVALEGRPEHKMIYTGLTEAFFTYLKVSLWAAVCIA